MLAKVEGIVCTNGYRVGLCNSCITPSKKEGECCMLMTQPIKSFSRYS